MMKTTWIIPALIVLAGCGSVSPTGETLRSVAVEAAQRGFAAGPTGLLEFKSDAPVNPSVSPSGQDVTLALMVRVPMERPAAKPDPMNGRRKDLGAAEKSAEAARIRQIVPEYKPVIPDLKIEPVRAMVKARKHELRRLATEIVRAEPFFWPDAAAADSLVQHIMIDEPQFIESPYGLLQWANGRCSVTLHLVSQDIAGEFVLAEGREGVLAATLTVYRRKLDLPECELTLLADKAIMRDYVADGGGLRTLGTVVYPGPTVLARENDAGM